MGIHRIDGIRIHPGNLIVRKDEFQLLLELLGTGADGLQMAFASGTPLGHRLGKAAVVAHQPVVGAVIGQLH